MDRNVFVRLGAVVIFVATAAMNAAEPITFESGETQTALLELFTSEGCSSCPPADAWISRLKSSTDLWTRVVPIVWHVDYWDRLGWRDRFAKPEFTARQRRYSAEWGNGTIYTPGFVLNGREWRDWSDTGRLPSSDANGGKLRVSVGDKVVAQFDGHATTPLQLQVALLGTNLESSVARGENSGRKLHHDFVVLATACTPMQRTGDSYAASLALPNEQSSNKPAAIAAWITSGDGGPPIQVTGGWLKP